MVLKQVGDYLIPGIVQLPQLEKVMKKRGITKEQYAVAPVDVFESEHENERSPVTLFLLSPGNSRRRKYFL